MQAKGIKYSAKIRHNMKVLLKTGKLSDVTFVVGKDKDTQRKFKCHKTILSARSPVFQAMFYSKFAESSMAEIDVTLCLLFFLLSPSSSHVSLPLSFLLPLSLCLSGGRRCSRYL
jgi:hypothetical protein